MPSVCKYITNCSRYVSLNSIQILCIFSATRCHGSYSFNRCPLTNHPDVRESRPAEVNTVN